MARMLTSKVYGAHNVYAGTVLGAGAQKGDKGQRQRKDARRAGRITDVTHEYVWTWPTAASHPKNAGLRG